MLERSSETSNDAPGDIRRRFVDRLLSIHAKDYQKAYETLARARGLLTDGTNARLECEVAGAPHGYEEVRGGETSVGDRDYETLRKV